MPTDKNKPITFNLSFDDDLSDGLADTGTDRVPLCSVSRAEIVELVLKDVARKHKLTPEDFAAVINEDSTITLYDADDAVIDDGSVSFEGTLTATPGNWYDRAKQAQARNVGSVFDDMPEVFMKSRTKVPNWYKRSLGQR